MVRLLLTALIISIFTNAYSQTTNNNKGTDFWLGKVSSEKSLKYYYIGSYQEDETFQQYFGDNGIFEFNGNKIQNRNFKVEYQMKSSKEGCYICDFSANNYGSLLVNHEPIIDTRDLVNVFSCSHLLMNISPNSILKLYYRHFSGPHYLKFLNLIKLNSIVKNESQIVCSGEKPHDIDGYKPPKKLKISETKNLEVNAKYKWQERTKEGNWIDASGKNYNFYYSPPLLYNKGNNDTTFWYRRIATYTQIINTKIKHKYIDSTAIAKVIVRPVPKGNLICNQFCCEGNEKVLLIFEGDEDDNKYDITINDGTKDTTIYNIISGKKLNLNYREENIKTFRIKKISNNSNKCTNVYTEDKQPKITLKKHKKIKTRRIHRVRK